MLEEEVPTWSHEFEEGPPKLEEHELEAVDLQSRKTEIERLMDMKVLKPISEAQATSGSYKHLSTKIVYDWRHRDGQWKRRGRLVAREFRWLTDYDLAALFSPTGVASTVKLLSALFVSTDHYSLGSVDIGDAYLQVEQDEPTLVEVDGEWYELGYTLPGSTSCKESLRRMDLSQMMDYQRCSIDCLKMENQESSYFPMLMTWKYLQRKEDSKIS